MVVVSFSQSNGVIKARVFAVIIAGNLPLVRVVSNPGDWSPFVRFSMIIIFFWLIKKKNYLSTKIMIF